MNQTNKQVLGVVITTLLVLGALVFFHEQAHIQINHKFGCGKTEQGINWNGIYTKCVDLEEFDAVAARPIHLINEVVGYALVPGFTFIYLVVGMNGVRRNDKDSCDCARCASIDTTSGGD